MRAIRNDSVEVLDMITDPTAPAHVISRLLAASEEHVRNVLLDPALRAIWARSGAHTTSIHSVKLDQGELLVKEFVQGQVIDIRIHLQERTTGCAVDVELRLETELDIANVYDLSIDDLWEARLYAIADLLASRKLRITNAPRIPVDQLQLTSRHYWNMGQQALFKFIVEKNEHTVTVERSFNAPVDLVWAAWTDPEILCKWWAPKPYRCLIKSLDFREGGRWLYCMEGPQGDRHWCFFDYEAIRPKSYFSGSDAFCNEQGEANSTKPKVRWEAHFSESDGRTIVRIQLYFDTTEDLEQIVQMGFKEGFTMGLDQLDELLVGPKA